MPDIPIAPEARSSGALPIRRKAQSWAQDREFKILSIDGGGIKGIYPALVLAELEERYLNGQSVAEHFDLLTGTSTGGIIALGLSLRMKARQMADLYLHQGEAIFPPYAKGIAGKAKRAWHNVRQFAYARYDREALTQVLNETFGDTTLGQAKSRLCIPSADGHYGDVYIFKTPHHPDYKKDLVEPMTKVALATAAAPTYFQPLDSGGYRFLDGGLWSNNPIMVGLVDALACFDVDRHQVRILSLGCGDEPFTVSDTMARFGGLFSWRKAIHGAMALQSKNAIGQAKLLIGAERIVRCVPEPMEPAIELDDWRRACDFLPGQALEAVKQHGQVLARNFFA